MQQSPENPIKGKERSRVVVLVKEFFRFDENYLFKLLKFANYFQFSDILHISQNKAFVFLSLSAAIFATLVSGFSTFGPKFVESQLGKSASDAANLFGNNI